MKTIITLSILIILSLFGVKASAQPHVGSSITYTCVGGNSYIVKYIYYRDCSAIAAMNSVQINFKCHANSAFNFTGTAYPIPGTGQEVTPHSHHNLTTCAGYAYSAYGVTEHVYQLQVTLPPCNKWEMYYFTCCRNPVTTTTSTYNLYVNAYLDNQNAPCNSSPIFHNKPMLIVGNSREVNYNPGAVDPDGDSLVYSFVGAKTSNATSIVNYVYPYSSTNFLNSSIPIHMDSITGDVRFKPSINLVTIYSVMVEEYRKVNGVPILIGSIVRDVQLKVDYANNNSPLLSGIATDLATGYDANDTLFHTQTCPNANLQFRINAFDPDTLNSNVVGSPEIFNLSWNNGIPAGTFQSYHNNTDSAYAVFSWTPMQADAGKTKCFTVKVQDSAAPYNAIGIHSYCVTVKPLNVSLGNDRAICEGAPIVLQALANMPVSQYAWIVDTTMMYNTTQDTSSINQPGVGLHHVVVTAITGAGCSSSDDIFIEVVPKPVFDLGSDTMIHPASSLLLSGPVGMNSYLWSTGDSTMTIYASQNNGNWDQIYYLQSEDTNGCVGEDSIRVIFSSVGMEEKNQSNLLMYPTPVGDYLFIDKANSTTEHLQLLTADGRLLRTITLSELVTKVNVSELPAGLYFIRDLEGDRITKKIIKY